MLKTSQERVYEWIKEDLSLSGFAEVYKGAIILILQKQPGYITFAAHAGRDLMNRLASSVSGVKAERVQYQQHIDKIQTDWRDEWRFSNEISPVVVEKGHLIPIDICQRISTLIDEHKSGRLRSSESDGLFFSTFLDYSDRDKIPSNFLSEWKEAKSWFLAHAHLRDMPFHAGADQDLVHHFNCLDGYLFIAASSQYDRLKVLNEILDATNQ